MIKPDYKTVHIFERDNKQIVDYKYTVTFQYREVPSNNHDPLRDRRTGWIQSSRKERLDVEVHNNFGEAVLFVSNEGACLRPSYVVHELSFDPPIKFSDIKESDIKKRLTAYTEQRYEGYAYEGSGREYRLIEDELTPTKEQDQTQEKESEKTL